MPGNVRRSDSTRSDSSTDSRKKVSFNRAVKVKKYSRPLKHSQQGTGEVSPEKRFWFKVYKNRHNEEPDLVKESRDYNGDINYSNEDLLHPSQMPAENPYVRKDYVKQIVNQFNQDSVLKPNSDKQVNGHARPLEPPADYGGNIRHTTNEHQASKQKKNPLVNGVKVMFGINSLRKKSKEQVRRKNMINSKKYQGTATRNEYSEDEERGPHTTNIIIPDNRKSERSHSNSRVSSVNGSNTSSKRNGYSRSPYSNATTETWDSGDRLVLDVNQLDTSVDDTVDGKFSKTLEQNHRMWTREKSTRYDEPLFAINERNKSFSNKNVISEIQPPPRSRRKAKGLSNGGTKTTTTSPDAFKKKTRKQDKAIQCDELWDDSEESWDSEQLSELENCRIIKSKNGFVSAFSDVPSLEKKTDVVYSQVDKSKKKRRPPLAVPVDISLEEAKAKEDSYYKHTNVKTTKKSFGMKLKNGFHENVYDIPVEKDWYDVDGELEDATWSQRLEKEEESSEAETAPSSVIREVDYKKKEISYENVPRKEIVKNGNISSDRLWFHKVDDDYRRDMVQNEPNSDFSYSSLGRQKKSTRADDLSMGRSHTLDRHRAKGEPQFNNVKILVNGKEVNGSSENKCIRGGLAASYQSRQKAALRRSNSSAAGIFTRTPNRLSPNRGGSSAASGISSSDSETSRRRKPVVLYIPGVSHPDRSIEEDDRSSGINVARTQSMLSSSKPAKYRSRVKTSRPSSSEKSDLSRSNSIPKNVKFPWFKWKVRAKPSREP